MRFDSPAVLKRVLEHPEIFPVGKEVDDFARKLVKARMKSVATIDDLKRTCDALGHDMFRMVADGLTDPEAKAVVTKVDPNNKEAKTAGGPAQRVLLVELGTGHVDPRAVAIKAAPKPRPGKAKSGAGQAMQSTATLAVRESQPAASKGSGRSKRK